ncbi:hypothetical protein EFA46_002290 [Halarchaeum sp. CBA1220]|uniref:DUF7544 domain-containing protein n=1 Tax=Halarchaeum sp. CBA1220 TaxID=1853682 RepID=UPI000F3A88F7|nr:hypothetical protein [Halarchaeum sp. CBA1220]QLC33084.1 hypothetical protein EFA46_002290 [Halarchaeum sp. CBA1220]
MALHAVDDVTDALSTTTAFLRELTPVEWLKLALVAVLTGGVSSGFSGSGNVNTGDVGTVPDADLPSGSLGDVLAVVPLWVWALLAAALLLGVVFAVVGAALEFTFVDALVTGDVELRATLAAHWGQGLRLFAFRFLLGSLVLGVFALAIAPVLLGLPVGALFLLLLPVGVVLALCVAVVLGFTRAFVVPIMYCEGVGVLAGWRRLWGVLRAHPKEYGVFFVANLVLTLVGGVAVAIVLVLALIPVAIVVGLVFGLPFALAGAGGALAWTWLGVGLLLGLLTTLLLGGLVSAPVQAYLRYYPLLLLGDTETSLDLIPERRADARSDDADGDEGDAA